MHDPKIEQAAQKYFSEVNAGRADHWRHGEVVRHLVAFAEQVRSDMPAQCVCHDCESMTKSEAARGALEKAIVNYANYGTAHIERREGAATAVAVGAALEAFEAAVRADASKLVKLDDCREWCPACQVYHVIKEWEAVKP
jgi:hypothetical protein